MEYVETLAKIHELFPNATEDRAFEIADRAHGRTVLQPERLEAAIVAFREQNGGPYAESHAAVSAAIIAYMRHELATAET